MGIAHLAINSDAMIMALLGTFNRQIDTFEKLF